MRTTIIFILISNDKMEHKITRRDFLRKTVLGLGALVIATSPPLSAACRILSSSPKITIMENNISDESDPYGEALREAIYRKFLSESYGNYDFLIFAGYGDVARRLSGGVGMYQSGGFYGGRSDAIYVSVPKEDLDRWSIWVAHEAGHRWSGGGNVRLMTNGGIDSIINGGHYVEHLHAGGADPLGSNTWRDNSDGTFTKVTDNSNLARWSYNDVTLYGMGVKSYEECGDVFYIRGKSVEEKETTKGSRTDCKELLLPQRGAYTPEQLEDLVRRYGLEGFFKYEDFVRPLRHPNLPPAEPYGRKNYRAGLVIVTDNLPSVSPGDIEHISKAARIFERDFRRATGERAEIGFA